MKKKIISLSLVAAMLISTLSTAGMSVFADQAESTTDTGSTTVIAASENTTTSTTKSKLDIIGDAIKEKVKEEIKEKVKEQGQALVSKAIDNMTATTASTTTTSTTAASTEATSATESSSASVTSTTASSVDGSTTASSEETTAAVTTKPTAVSASDLKPAKIDCKAVAKAVIKKILSKKLNPITVSQKNVTVLKGHYSYINAKAQGLITYYSTNSSVATVDKYGIIKGVSQGNARIRIIAWGNSEYHPSTTYVTVNVTPSLSDYLSDLFAPIYKY